MTDNTKRIVQEFYTALAARDLEVVASKFSDTLDWYIPSEKSLAPWLGHRKNKEEVKAFFELLLQNIESVSFKIEHIVAEGNFAVATGHFISKMLSTGVLYESPFSAHFTVENNQIIRYRFLEDSNGLVKALKSSS